MRPAENSFRNFGLQAKVRSLLSEAIFVLTLPPPVTQHPSRKHFLAKLLGVFAVSSVGAKLVAKPAAGAAVGRNRAVTSSGGLEVRGDSRTVARRADSL